MLASVSDFYLHITFKIKEVIPYTTCYITFQLLVRIDRVNKLNVSYLQIYRYTLLLIPHLKTGILNINTKLKARWAKTNQRALTESRYWQWFHFHCGSECRYKYTVLQACTSLPHQPGWDWHGLHPNSDISTTDCSRLLSDRCHCQEKYTTAPWQ